MVKEIDFKTHREIIESFRRSSYGNSITHVLDQFDEQAHHFALFDKRDNILGVTRVLRSDEVEKFEMMHESQLKDLVLPSARLSLELSRACTIKGSGGIHLLKMCMGINEYAVKNEAEYLITKTGKHLLPLYQHFGFSTFAPPFVSDFFEDKRPIYPIMYRWTTVKREEPEEEVLVW
ncbi:GNAT family N-acyltransferase [Prosthecobacter sp.]|uniref:GNAT family N-acyltransferase n=1 Tax=Prosthecobacter sp. TaxID=1965333 RepID=UPI0037845C3D